MESKYFYSYFYCKIMHMYDSSISRKNKKCLLVQNYFYNYL